MISASRMSDEEIASELSSLEEQWKEFHSGDDDDYGGGSPGEWMVERMGELEQEQKKRLKR